MSYIILERGRYLNHEDEYGTLYEWLLLNSEFTARGPLPTCYDEWREAVSQRIAYHQIWVHEGEMVGWVGVEGDGEIHIVMGPLVKGHAQVLPTAEEGLRLIFARFGAVYGYGHLKNRALYKFTKYLGFTHEEQPEQIRYDLTKENFYGRAIRLKAERTVVC